MKVSAILSIVLFSFQSCTFQKAKLLRWATGMPNYVLTVTKQDIRNVHVDALIPIRSDTLYMSPVAVSPLRDGYGTFVHHLTAKDTLGNNINLASLGNGKWRVDVPHNSVIQLSYDVAMRHDTVQWSVSAAFARAYTADNILFFTGRTVFIVSKGLDSSRIQVRFVLPEEWKVATTYTTVDSVQRAYEADDFSELLDNGNLVGEFTKEDIGVGRLRITMAGSFSMGNGLFLLRDMISKVVNSYTTDMGGAAEGSLIIMGSVTLLAQGGETFPRSISLLFNQPPSMDNKDQWALLLSHEIFHLWNGEAMIPVSQPKVEWFVEGFTNYFSLLTTYRTGFLSESEFLQQIASYCDSYRQQAGRISMIDAGQDIGVNYGLIYGGGAMVAMTLDILCRQATENKYGVRRILTNMYSGFGADHKRYSYADIVRASGEVAHKDMSHFFENYVAGLQVLPLEQILGFAGLRLKENNVGAFIEQDKAASRPEKELFEKILRD